MARLVRINKEKDTEIKSGGVSGPHLVKLPAETAGGGLTTRTEEAARDIPRLSLPAPPTQAEPYRGPAWAQEMAERYKPATGENVQMSPAAQWEAQKKREAAGKVPEARDWAGLAGNTLMAGVGQVSKASSAALSAAEQLVSRPLGWLLGNPELYKDAPLYKLDKAVDQDVAAIQKDLAGSAGKTGKAGELIAQFGPATVAALPQAALAYLTAGQSLAAQASTAGLQAASTAAQLTGGAAAANTVLQAVKGMAANPSFQYSFLNTVGGEYQQALEDGADAPTAYAYAALSSLANSVVEVGGGIDTLPEAVRGKSKGQLLEWVKSMFDEGKEEVVQGAISQMMQNGVYQKGNPIFSMTDENAVVNPGRMAEEFAGGAVVGGVLGGGQMAVNKALASAAQKSDLERAGLSLPELGDARNATETEVEGQGTPEGIPVPPKAQTRLGSKENRAQEATGGRSFSEEIMRQLTGGFVPGTNDAEISKADRRMLDNLGKITRSEIRVVSQEELDRVAGKPGADGIQLGGQIYISEAADRPVLEIARHELTHRLQETAPEEYGAFRDYVAGVYRADGSLDGYIQSIRASWASAGIELSDAEIMDEIAADYAGELLVDERAVRRLAGENRGLLERMLDGLREIIAKIRRAFGGKTDAQTEELERAARLWENALHSAADSRGGDSAGEPEGLSLPAPRFSFGGRNARKADSGSLTRAQILESQGMTAEDIRKDTGWFRGMDGLWRFEIDDSRMEYSQWGDMRRSDRAEYARFRELEGKFIEGTITEAEQAELRGLLDGGHGSGRAAEQGTLRLADYIRHDELFRNYPQLKGATLRFAELEPGAQGSYNPETNTITISEKLQTAPEDIIMHEVQHAIQTAEGFAKGSSPEYWKEKRKEITETIKNARENLDLWLNDIGYSQYAKQSIAEVIQKEKSMDQHWKDLQSYKDNSQYAEQIRKCEEELRHFQEQYDEITGKMTPTEQYWNTAGEIEARDVTGRRRMTAEERRQTPPALGDENTVFAEGNGESSSIDYDEDNRPFVTVEEDILEGVPREDWVRTVKENLRKKFPNGVTVGNREIKIDGTSRREMTFSRYMQQLMRTDRTAYADKLRSTNNADEILRATRDWINEPLLHPRKDAMVDFARGTVQMRVGENEYTAEVVVGSKGDGQMLLYDVINLMPTSIQTRKEAGTDYTTKPREGTGSRQSAPADRTLPYPAPDVKPMRSFSDEVMAQLTGEDTRSVDAPAIADSFSDEVMRQLTGGRGDVSDLDTSDTSGNTRFSMKGDAELKKEIDRLRRQNQRLKEQMKRTDRAEMSRESVERQARELLKEYGSRYDRNALGGRLKKLYDGIANQTISESDMRSQARSIAEDILAENQEQTNGLYEEYQELRKELRTRGISIAPEYWADLESAGGYEGLRKQYFGRLRLSKDGAAVDQVYDDLSDRYPELFPDSILHPSDQLVRITEVLDDLRPVMGNAYEGGMDQAAEYLAGELLERYYDTPEKAPTFADKQARKMAEQRSVDRRQMLEVVARERAKKETALQELREKYQKADRKRIENQTISQRRETIRRHADRLGRMLLRPTDKKHVPEDLRGAALELVRQIDTGSNYFLDPDTGKRVYTRDGTQIDMESPGQVQTRRTAAARELQAQYEKLAAEGGYTVDPDMGSYLDELANMGGKALGDMSRAELDTVWKVMRVIEHCISKSNELLGRSRYATVSEMAERLREENGGKKGRRNFTGLAGAVDQLVNMDMLTPETYFHKLGDAGEAIYKEMRSAADRQTGILKEGVEKAQKLTKESGIDLRKAEKELHTFSTSGGELTLSTAQIMELYALSKREQALEHIYVGGLKPVGARKGMEAVGKAAPVKVTPSDVADIIGTLTAEQKKLVDGLQGYLSRELSRHGNDASMEVYGYEKFKEKNYWPIKVDRNQTKSDIKKEAESRTVAGYGMTKAVKPQARNAVVLRGILDSYTEHLNQMATYSGWLAASEDVNRVHNYVFQDGEGGADGTVKTLLEQVYGKGGNSYLDKLMADIAMGTKAGAEPSPMDRGLNQFKAAKVGGNLRVILQQPTAIIRAANMLDAKYFMSPRNPMKGWETAKKYAPIAQWKDWGYFELDTGRSLKEEIAGTSGVVDKVKNVAMKPAGWADSVAWGHLWNAVEAETAEKHPDLRRGSEEFYRKAAERFGEIIDRTQVVDSVLHRTQIMRSANSLTRMSTSFMSEPSKIYNMVYRDLFDVQQAKSGAARKKAGKALARSTTALIVSFAVNAVAQSLPDAWRDKDRDKSFWEKLTDAHVSNFLENFDPVSYVPFLKDFESIVQGYSVDRSDLEGFSDVVNALSRMKKAMAGESEQSEAAAALELACKAGDLLGLPVSNIKRDVAGIFRTALQGAGNVELQYALDKLGLNPDKAAATFYDDLYRAMGKDWEQYENIYKDMELRGWDKDKLKENMERRMAKEAGLEKTSSLPVEYSVPGKNLTFDQEIMRQLTGGKTWMDSLPEGTLELARDLEQLEPEEGEDSVTKMQKIRELRDSVWGDEVKELALENILGDADYKRMQAARKAGISIEKWCQLYEAIADQKIKRTGKSGSPSQADVSAALEKSGLTERQKDVIWRGYWDSERVKGQEEESGSQLPGLSLPSLQ